MYNKAKIKVEMIPEFIKEMKNKVKFIPDKSPYFEYRMDIMKTGKLIQKQKNLCNEINEVLNIMKNFIIIE